MVSLDGVVGVVQRVLVPPPLAVTLGTQEGDPATVGVVGLWNVGLGIDVSVKLLLTFVRSGRKWLSIKA